MKTTAKICSNVADNTIKGRFSTKNNSLTNRNVDCKASVKDPKIRTIAPKGGQLICRGVHNSSPITDRICSNDGGDGDIHNNAIDVEFDYSAKLFALRQRVMVIYFSTSF